jgi:hypothetical protein
MLKRDKHEGLRGLGCRSIIPYDHGREGCIAVCVVLFKAELNLSIPVICPDFYSSRSGSYSMTQSPTGGSGVVGSLYSRVLPARSSK